MKKLRKNSGFTLVECVVAMAVLAVMTLGLLMILSVTVRQRNQNTQTERDMDYQVEQVVNGNSKTEDLSDGDGDIEIGGFKIGGAQKVYFDGADDNVQIGSLHYDIGSSSYEGDPDDGGDGEKKDDDEYNGLQKNPLADSKVYGILETTKNDDGKSYINVSEQSKIDNGDGTTTIVWRITFDVIGAAGSDKSIKVVFPYYCDGFKLVAYELQSGSECYVHKIGGYTVRIEPKKLDGNNPKTTHNEVDVEFVVKTDSLFDKETDPKKQIAPEYILNITTREINLIKFQFGSTTPVVNE